MVEERTLLKLAFIVSIVGIVLLYLFADSIILPETRLNETQNMDGKTIKLFGTVKSVKSKVSDNNNSNPSTILTIQQTNTITVYADDVVNVSKGDDVEVLGRLDDKGKIVYSEEIKVKK